MACWTAPYGFGGEESAGASFLRHDGAAWTTDKDGIIMDLLAAEITAVTGRDPGEHYQALEARFGSPVYERMDAPGRRGAEAVLANLSPDLVTATELAGEPITAKLTRAPAQRRGDRRAQGGDGERLVRRAAIGHRGRVQDLRRELPRGRSPAADPSRGAGHRQCCIPSGRRVTFAHARMDGGGHMTLTAYFTLYLFLILALGAGCLPPASDRADDR